MAVLGGVIIFGGDLYCQRGKRNIDQNGADIPISIRHPGLVPSIYAGHTN